MLFARRLLPDEREALRAALLKNDLPRDVRTRLLIVDLSSRGASVPEVVRELGVHKTTVWRWLNAFNQHGLSRLLARDRRGGPRPRVTETQKAAIARIASTSPEELGLAFSSWSLRRLRDYLKARSVVTDISRERLRQILKSQGISLRGTARTDTTRE